MRTGENLVQPEIFYLKRMFVYNFKNSTAYINNCKLYLNTFLKNHKLQNLNYFFGR